MKIKNLSGLLQLKFDLFYFYYKKKTYLYFRILNSDSVQLQLWSNKPGARTVRYGSAFED
jgi:hypothetical protein